jgi:hypothetical protein
MDGQMAALVERTEKLGIVHTIKLVEVIQHPSKSSAPGAAYLITLPIATS